jgi:kumamolisin
VWNELANNEGATGGGVSNFFALPSWQANANVPAPTGSTGGRGVPDVAGDADPTTGYQIRVDGQDTVIGGTSAVAPLWAGLIAVANQQLGTQVGFIQPAIYAAKAASALNDITQGNNGAFYAGPGWDACTGLGSPIAAKLIPLLAPAGTTPTPTPAPTPTPTPEPAPPPPPPVKKKRKKKHAEAGAAGKTAGKKVAGKKAGKKAEKKSEKKAEKKKAGKKADKKADKKVSGKKAEKKDSGKKKKKKK